MARPTRRSGNLPAEASSFIGRPPAAPGPPPGRGEQLHRPPPRDRGSQEEAHRGPPGQPRRAGRGRQDTPGDPGSDRSRTRLPRRRMACRARRSPGPGTREQRSHGGSGPAGPGRGRAPGPCAFLPAGQGTAAGRGQLRASARSSRTGRERHDESCAGRAGDRHQPLSVPGEHVVPVPPLELPSPQAAESLARLRQNETVMLFTQRAAAAAGTFELTAANQAAVADLCRRLDGLPLAIELAAVRTRVLTAEQILDRLTDRFGLLTGGSRAALPRHQTLRTTIEWSHDLLSGGERAVLRRSCAFAGRFTLEDVESVCTSQDVPAAQALDLLSSLVDKSLVMKEDAKGLACYRLHETMREFAALKLAEAGEQEAVELRCAEYYRSRCRRSALEGNRLLEWLEWADLEIDNIRAVLQRCLARADAEVGIDLARSLGWYWITRATTEGMRWLDEFLASGGGSPEARAWALFMRGFLAVLKADPAAARPALRAAVAAARPGGQQDLLVQALCMASIAENMVGDRASARRLLDEAQGITTGVAHAPGTLAVLQARALGGFFEADLDAVRSAASDGVRVAKI